MGRADGIRCGDSVRIIILVGIKVQRRPAVSNAYVGGCYIRNNFVNLPTNLFRNTSRLHERKLCTRDVQMYAGLATGFREGLQLSSVEKFLRRTRGLYC